MKRAMAFIVCSIGMILPWRLRVWYADLLGWSLQGIYFVYVTAVRFLVKRLKKEEEPP